MNRPGRKITLQTIRMNNKLRKLELRERSSRSLLANVLDIEDDFRHCNISAAAAAAGTAASSHMNCAYLRSAVASANMHHSHPHPGAVGGAGMTLSLDDSGMCSSAQRDLQLILKEIQFITNRMRRADEEAEIISDWKFAAIVIDRFCLIVFTLFTIIATIVVLMSAPHIIVQ